MKDLEQSLACGKFCTRVNLGLPWWSSGEESTCQCGGHGFHPCPGRSHVQRGNQAFKPQLLSPLCRSYWSPHTLGLHCWARWLRVKNLPANAGDAGLIPGSGRSTGGGNGTHSSVSCLEKSVDRGSWQTTVHGVGKELYMTEQLGTHFHTL